MASQEKQCQDFVNACLRKRVSPETYGVLVTTFQDKYPTLRCRTLLIVLFKRTLVDGADDPRVPLYVREMLRLKIASLAEVLSSLLPSPSEPSSKGHNTYCDQTMLEVGSAQKPTLQGLVFQMLILEVSEGLLQTKQDVRAALKALIAWMSLFPGSTSLGYLVYAVLGMSITQETLGEASTKGLKKSFGRALSPLVPQLLQTNMQIATALDFWQKQCSLTDVAAARPADQAFGAVNMGSFSFQENFLDTPSVTTRAGTYIYLNALLHARPLFDDSTVMNYLNSRYKGDYTTLVIDLILASFDVLANAMYRSEPTESLTLLRSYLVNKLPVFLLNYASMMFEPMTVEYCISQALAHVDPTAFPSFSQMFDILGRNSVSEARQEFLFACALHQLIPEQNIEGLLGDVPMQSLPAGGRCTKHDLVAQCTANPSRVEELVVELENMEGNAGEIASALLEIMQTLCTNNDTMTLKGLCNALSRRLGALDVIMLFSTPEYLLRPLCNTLDNWQIHEDQGLPILLNLPVFTADKSKGENQPVYDEFGSILLFVMLVNYRFDLQRHDLRVSDSSSFILHYVRVASAAKNFDELTEKESKLLGAWVRGLFEENEGINDELMAASSPIEFHLVVATLLDQSLKACQAGFLAMSTLKDGLEYLLEPFLPSLIAGLTYFAHKIWETTEQSTNLDIFLPALTTLVKPRSISSDSSAMHSAVLSIVAKPLEHALQHAQRRHPRRADILPLLEALKPHAHKMRGDTTAFAELETWSATPGGSLPASLRHTLQSLILWASPSSTELCPPHYTHRQLILSLQVLGAKAVLGTLIDELMLHVTSPNSLDAALDVIVTMISAPQARFPDAIATTDLNSALPLRRQISLRDALKMLSDEADEISKKDVNRASVIVRLQRRVDTLVGRGHDAGQGVEGGLEARVGMSGLDTAVELVTEGIMGNETVKNADGLPTVDIDDVLEQATEDAQMSAAGFMTGGDMGQNDFMTLG